MYKFLPVTVEFIITKVASLVFLGSRLIPAFSKRTLGLSRLAAVPNPVCALMQNYFVGLE